MKGFKMSLTGSFVLDQSSPVPAGSAISFTVDVPNRPQGGGDSDSPFVEVVLGGVSIVAPANSPVTSGTENPSQAFLTLPSEVTGVAQAYLFYDGFHNPRRRPGNTLAELAFDVA